jgi:hypothetical protein
MENEYFRSIKQLLLSHQIIKSAIRCSLLSILLFFPRHLSRNIYSSVTFASPQQFEDKLLRGCFPSTALVIYGAVYVQRLEDKSRPFMNEWVFSKILIKIKILQLILAFHPSCCHIKLNQLFFRIPFTNRATFYILKSNISQHLCIKFFDFQKSAIKTGITYNIMNFSVLI